MGLDIVAIDSSDDDGKHVKDGGGALVALRTTFPNAILANNVHDMVQGILNRLGPSGRISRLRIYGHGEGGLQGMGDSYTSIRTDQLITVTARGQLTNRHELERLRGRFEPNAVIELQGCQVAHGHRGRELLRQLCDLWNIPVRAGTEIQQHIDGDTVDHFEGPIIESHQVPGHHARVRLVR